MTRRILIAGGGTGGHLMPALAIADAIRQARPDLEPVLVGALRGIESRILPDRAYRFHLLPAEPIYRRQWWRNLRWPYLALSLITAIRRVLQDEDPVLVVGTGGYVSGPVVWLAARQGIATAIQEQNAFPGLATRWLARRVGQVYLGLPEARQRLSPGRKTEVIDTGNPIVPPVAHRRPAARDRLGIRQTQKVLLVTGGSQGAIAINRAVAAWLESGGGKDQVILWATGRTSYQDFVGYHRPPGVQVFDFLDPMADALAAADLVVARAGAMTIAEICAWGLPSILIPLPTAAADHQTHNARALAEAGAAHFLAQAELTPSTLGDSISRFMSDDDLRSAVGAAALARGKPQAASDIVNLLGKLVAPA